VRVYRYMQVLFALTVIWPELHYMCQAGVKVVILVFAWEIQPVNDFGWMI